MEAADAPDTASRASSAPGSRAPSPPTVPGDADPTSRSSGTPAAHLARAAATPVMQAGLLPANLTESEMFRQLMQQQQQSKEQLIELMQKQTIKLEHILQQNDHTQQNDHILQQNDHKQQTELLEIGRRTEARLREIDIEGKLKDQLVELRRCARLERSPVVCPGLTLRAPHSQILTPPSARCLCAGRSKPRGLPSSTPTPRPRRSRRSTRTSWTSSSWR